MTTTNATVSRNFRSGASTISIAYNPDGSRHVFTVKSDQTWFPSREWIFDEISAARDAWSRTVANLKVLGYTAARSEEDECRVQFDRLAALLPVRPLMTETGETRIADADEFMFMGMNGALAAFKHRDSRNYVYVRDSAGRDVLFVPSTGQPFQMGTFDLID